MPEHNLEENPNYEAILKSLAPEGFRFLSNYSITALDGETTAAVAERRLRWAYGENNVVTAEAINRAGFPVQNAVAIYVREGVSPRRRWWQKLLDRLFENGAHALA